MVMMSSTLRGRVLKFGSPAVDPNTLLVLTVEGREVLSKPYRFELGLASKKTDLDLGALLQAPAFVGFKQTVAIRGGGKGIRTLKVQGILTALSQGEKGLDWIIYRAVLVPRLWRLSLNSGSRVFLDKSVPEIVEIVLKEHGVPFESRLHSSYPKREYVVQYQESDLDFVSRLLEHEGIPYWFLQGDDGEVVILGDSNAAFGRVEDPVPFRPEAPAEGWFGSESAKSIVGEHVLVPNRVVLQDYNYRTPQVDLKAGTPAAESGYGTVHRYGEHYKDPKSGGDLARIRSEELRCRERIFRGSGTVKSLRAGLAFELSDHYRRDFNRAYLLTEVRHKAEQLIPLASRAEPVASYENEFVAIPSDVPFRPERSTPKPKIVGTMHARVDAAGDGEYAEIDDHGRYKVTLPFDLSNRSGGTASRFIRMAQPYAGADFGMHFPLHKGTEVILTHVDGDPDRPIIAGAVPNPATGGPVTGKNASQCAIKTGGGNKIVFEDAGGGQRIKLSTPHEDSYFQIGSPNAPVNGIGMGTAANFQAKIGVDSHTTIGNDLHEEVGANAHKKIKGNVVETVLGGAWKKVKGSSHEFIEGKNNKFVILEAIEVMIGAKLGFITPLKAEMVAGLSRSVVVGQKWEMVLGAGATSFVHGQKQEFVKGEAFKVQIGKAVDILKGKKYAMTTEDEDFITFGRRSEILKDLKVFCKATAAIEAATKLRTKAKEMVEEAEKKRDQYDILDLGSRDIRIEAEKMHEHADKLEAEFDKYDLHTHFELNKGTLAVKK